MNNIKLKIIYLLLFLIVMMILVFVINSYVKSSTKSQVFDEDRLSDIKDIDCMLILGAGVWGDRPSPMLEDRLIKGIELYKGKVSRKILMSGDHRKKDYDEVNIMKAYAVERGIPSQDVFMDHAGISTYDSVYRAKEIFQAKKIIIVSQEYHLPRALYIARALGLNAYGISAKPNDYSGQVARDFREVLARNKDFFLCLFKPKAKILGSPIPISGNGDTTNDK
ncbi:MAG: DUF218 domain-containing protein [Tissierellia bacterium]|nr:DUF218 domain-containing protein [Tissierellia bacterium]